MDCYTKQWCPGCMTGTGPTGWESAMGLDMSVSPGTVIRPDMPLGSGPAKSAETAASPILMTQQGMSAGPCPWMPPKKTKCSDTKSEAETTPVCMRCPEMPVCPMPAKCRDISPCPMPPKCPEKVKEAVTMKCPEMPVCPMPAKCRDISPCPMPPKCPEKVKEAVSTKCPERPACPMPAKCRDISPCPMPAKCREMPPCPMPVKCPEKVKEAVTVKCPEMPKCTAPVTCPGWSAPSQTSPAENIDQFPVGMAYVPWQQWQQVYSLDVAMSVGTIFPDLNKPFIMGGCQ